MNGIVSTLQLPEARTGSASESLIDSVVRLTRQTDMGRISAGPALPGWFTADDLMSPGSPWLHTLLEAEGPRVGDDLRTRAAFLVEGYAGLIGTACALLYLGAGRVPRLRADTVGLQTETYQWQRKGMVGHGLRLRLRLLDQRFHVSMGEPTLPGATIVETADDLRDLLRSELQDHLSPLIARLKARSRLSPGAQWRLAADAIAAVFLDAGRQLACEDLAKAEAMALLKTSGSPLNNRQTGYIEVALNDRDREPLRRTFRVRGGCCRIYTCDGGDYCSTCVLEDPAVRYRRLQSSLRSQTQ